MTKNVYFFLRGHSASLKGATSFHRLAIKPTYKYKSPMIGGWGFVRLKWKNDKMFYFFLRGLSASLKGARSFHQLAIEPTYN
jgi:hypothetical protein